MSQIDPSILVGANKLYLSKNSAIADGAEVVEIDHASRGWLASVLGFNSETADPGASNSLAD